jgi:hypothetical protein
MKVFWSWQNDFEPTLNRQFIREALQHAVDAVGHELGLEAAERPELDHATKGTRGMVDIGISLFAKISESAIFVADVTPVAVTPGGKAVPNPNVLVELGWALQKPGPDRTIAVLNLGSGWKPDDLPFDIRQKLILTYELEPSADTSSRKKEAKRLAKALTEALKTNLQGYLEEEVAAKQVAGVSANQDDPSVWASASSTLQHHDSLGLAGWKTVDFPPGPRGYARIIPASWPKGVPTIDTIRQRSDIAVWPETSGGPSGDFGATEEGFVRYWISGTDATGRHKAQNAVMFFDKTGEYWAVQGTAVYPVKDGLGMDVARLLGGWSKAIRSANVALNIFQASPIRRIEIGVVGIKGARWPGQWSASSPPARKNAYALSVTRRDWDGEAQLSFLEEGLNGLRDLFALSRVNRAQVVDALKVSDPERFVSQ